MATTAVLYFTCGKMGAGKSTLARAIAGDNSSLLISEDDLLRDLYPNDVVDLASYVSCAGRVRQALRGHISTLLRRGMSVVLDFPANTVSQRVWFRELIEQSGAAHELHLLLVPDNVCKRQLKERALAKPSDPLQDGATFDLLSGYFVEPTPEESFMVVRHERS
jgi:predicted kinase